MQSWPPLNSQRSIRMHLECIHSCTIQNCSLSESSFSRRIPSPALSFVVPSSRVWSTGSIRACPGSLCSPGSMLRGASQGRVSPGHKMQHCSRVSWMNGEAGGVSCGRSMATGITVCPEYNYSPLNHWCIYSWRNLLCSYSVYFPSVCLFRSVSLSSLYSLLKARLCPYFYVCSYQVRVHVRQGFCPTQYILITKGVAACITRGKN